MADLYRHRKLSSRFAESATLIRFEHDGEMLVQPDNQWDIVFFRREGARYAIRTGLTTRPVAVSHKAGDEIYFISFLPGTYMPTLLGDRMRDTAVRLGMSSRRDVRVGMRNREIPHFDDVELFVEWLARDGTIEINDAVSALLSGRPRAISDRTMQRYFMKTTGLTYKHFTLVERARKAVTLLRLGKPALEVALALGYADQAHMINSLRRIMGQTPGQVVRSAPR